MINTNKLYRARILIASFLVAAFIFSNCQRQTSLEHIAAVNNLNGEALKNWNTNPEKMEELAREALRMSQQVNFDKGEAEAYRMIGVSYWARGINDVALENHLEALIRFEEQNDSLGIANTTMNIGLVYDEMGLQLESKQYYRKAQAFFSKLNLPLRLATLYNNLGAVHRKLEANDSALYFYKKALDLRYVLKDTFGIAESLSNFGEISLGDSNYAAALAQFKESLRLRLLIKDNQGIALSYLNSGVALHHLKQIEEANLMLETSLRYSSMSNSKRWQLEAYMHLKEIAQEQGNYKQAYEWAQKEYETWSSIFDTDRVNAISNLDLQYKDQKKLKKIRLLELQNERDRLIRNFLIFFLVAGIVMSVIIYFVQRKKEKAKLELTAAQLDNLALKAGELSKEISSKKGELAAYTVSFLEKTQWIEELQGTVNQLKEKDPKNQARLKRFLDLLEGQSDLKNQWENYKLEFEKIHPEFFRELKERAPDLSNSELRLCILLRLNFNLKESAEILGISPDSIKGSRHRLRKKFGLEKESSLTEFVSSI